MIGWMARGFAAAFFASLALASLAWGLIVGSRAFGGYQDSEPALYLAVGVLGVGFAVLFGLAAAMLAGFASGRKGWGIVLGAALLACLVPWRPMFGDLALLVYAPLALLGLVALGRILFAR